MATTKSITVSTMTTIVGFGVITSEENKEVSLTFTPSEVLWNDGYSARIRNIVSTDGNVATGLYDVDVIVSSDDTNDTLFSKSDSAISSMF